MVAGAVTSCPAVRNLLRRARRGWRFATGGRRAGNLGFRGRDFRLGRDLLSDLEAMLRKWRK